MENKTELCMSLKSPPPIQITTQKEESPIARYGRRFPSETRETPPLNYQVEIFPGTF